MTEKSKKEITIKLRDISYKDAKQEILEYHQKHPDKTIYVSDLLKELRIDLDIIMEVREELKKEGLIEGG